MITDVVLKAIMDGGIATLRGCGIKLEVEAIGVTDQHDFVRVHVWIVDHKDRNLVRLTDAGGVELQPGCRMTLFNLNEAFKVNISR